ncbi:MAG: alpha-L-fucosidase [Acidobacteria bacterium]|nr:alpha-L-fucosidase [Acidobacteriota bacterium]
MQRRAFLLSSALAPLAAPQAPDIDGKELPFRQVHLDFHTSELIPDVGADFDPAEFARTLQQARVNSINVFAKCHHGYAYYDTKIAARHPALKTDMLGGMVKSCRAAGIRVNYYYSLVWDVLQSRRHPDWLMIDKDGHHIGGPPTDQWPWLCMNTPYLDQVIAENKEIVDNYEIGGVFFDILKQPPDGCFCRWCKAERAKLNLSTSPEHIFQHNKLVAKRVEKLLYDVVRSKRPNALTFFNSRLVIGVRDELPFYTHIEIESLPTGGWGYTHFHQRVRYMRTLNKEMVGMTGRFHKSWGDFGGLKNQAALDYECLNFLANGAKVCIGDQLHPRGRLDPATYSRIGKTYARIEALEPWAKETKGVADIGVISIAATNPDTATQKVPPVDQGFTNMLNELHHQFDILDTESDLAPYKVVIVPDEIRAVPAVVERVRKHVAAGRALLLSNLSLFDREASKFAVDIGVQYEGPARFKGEYMLLNPEHFPTIDQQPYFLYQHGTSVVAKPGTQVLATYGHPYFDRSPESFSSHKQTPFGRATKEPLITQNGNTIYVANPFFRSYSADGYAVQKQVIAQLIDRLLPEPSLQTKNLPSCAQATLLTQPFRSPARFRHIVHLLYYPMTRRAPDIDIIEEPGLMENIELRVRRAIPPRKVYLAPSQQSIPFRMEASYAVCTVPRVYGHQAVVFE